MPANSPLATATPEQLEAWAQSITDAQETVQKIGIPPADAFTAAADLLRAVAKAERDNFAFVDYPFRPVTAALAALLETDR